MDINFPLIVFRGENAIDLANKTMQHLNTLCEYFYTNKDDRIITISIGIEYKDKVVIFSFVSHVDSIYLSNKKNPIQFPDTDDIGKWCNKQHEFLMNSYFIQNTSDSYLDKSGIFFINRFDISNLIEIDDNGIYSLKTKNKGFAEAIAKGDINITPSFIINKSTCSKCGEEYIKCNCSVFLDKNCMVKVESVHLNGFFLSKRM